MSRSTAPSITLRVPRQERQDAADQAARTGGWPASSRPCQDLPGQELFQYLDEERRAPHDQLGRRERLSARDQRATTSPPRTSAPGRARCWPRWRCRSSRRRHAGRGQAQRHAGDRARRRQLGNTPADLPQMLRPSRGARLLSRRHAGRDALGEGRRRRCAMSSKARRRGGRRARLPAAAAGGKRQARGLGRSCRSRVTSPSMRHTLACCAAISRPLPPAPALVRYGPRHRRQRVRRAGAVAMRAARPSARSSASAMLTPSPSRAASASSRRAAPAWTAEPTAARWKRTPGRARRRSQALRARQHPIDAVVLPAGRLGIEMGAGQDGAGTASRPSRRRKRLPMGSRAARNPSGFAQDSKSARPAVSSAVSASRHPRPARSRRSGPCARADARAARRSQGRESVLPQRHLERSIHGITEQQLKRFKDILTNVSGNPH